MAMPGRGLPEPPGRPLGAGRSTNVYDLGGGRILRRYHDRTRSAEREADLALCWVTVALSSVPGSAWQQAIGRAGQRQFADAVLRHAGLRVDGEWLAKAARFKLDDPHLLEAEAVRIRHMLGRADASSAVDAGPGAGAGPGPVPPARGRAPPACSSPGIGAVGDLSRAALVLGLGPLLAAVLIATSFPETAGAELEAITPRPSPQE